MKPTILAKNLWDHAIGVQKKMGDKPNYRDGAVYSYYGILTMFAAAQAAYYGKDQEWFDEVMALLNRYPFEFEFHISPKKMKKCKLKLVPVDSDNAISSKIEPLVIPSITMNGVNVRANRLMHLPKPLSPEDN